LQDFFVDYNGLVAPLFQPVPKECGVGKNKKLRTTVTIDQYSGHFRITGRKQSLTENRTTERAAWRPRRGTRRSSPARRRPRPGLPRRGER
jgi:hypothetical protein